MGDVEFFVDDSHAQWVTEQKVQAVRHTGLAQFFRERVTPWFVDRSEDRFEGHGDDASGAWKPLAFPTRQVRQEAGYGASGPINVRTGELKDFYLTSSGDITSTGESAAQLKWPDATPTGLLGTKIRTAQRGSKTSKTPARPVVAFNDTDARHIELQMMAWVSAAGGVGAGISS